MRPELLIVRETIALYELKGMGILLKGVAENLLLRG